LRPVDPALRILSIIEGEPITRGLEEIQNAVAVEVHEPRVRRPRRRRRRLPPQDRAPEPAAGLARHVAGKRGIEPKDIGESVAVHVGEGHVAGRKGWKVRDGSGTAPSKPAEIGPQSGPPPPGRLQGGLPPPSPPIQRTAPPPR